MESYGRALVLGMGVSGAAAAKLLLAEGVRVVVVDSRDTDGIRAKAAELGAAGAETAPGCGSLPGGEFDVCVVSPGVAIDSVWMNEVRRRRIPFISELELGTSRCRCPLLAVTGSKGKSTMVKLCVEALSRAGCRTVAAGNYGVPVSEVAGRSGELDRIVAEVSSFQLETVRDFRPDVGVVLNIQPDHLDRHGDMQTYARAKSRIFDAMQECDTGIVFEPDAKRVATLSRGRYRRVSFGTGATADYRYCGGVVRWREPVGDERTVSLTGTRFDNDVMGVTAAAAVAAVLACGVDAGAVVGAALEFEPLPHRMQRVGDGGGVTFVNDSKATSLSAVEAALRMCPGRVRLIAGGLLKEGALDLVVGQLVRKVAKVYLIGRAADAMAAAWGGVVPCERCGVLRAAVERAWLEREAGETILLSPGCASFDQFINFEERGNRFAELVRPLLGPAGDATSAMRRNSLEMKEGTC